MFNTLINQTEKSCSSHSTQLISNLVTQRKKPFYLILTLKFMSWTRFELFVRALSFLVPLPPLFLLRTCFLLNWTCLVSISLDWVFIFTPFVFLFIFLLLRHADGLMSYEVMCSHEPTFIFVFGTAQSV